MLQTQQLLDRDPVRGLKALAHRLQVDPRRIVENAQDAQGQSSGEEPYVQQLTQRLHGIESTLAQAQNAQKAERFNSLVSEAKSFVSEKDAEGNLRHPMLEVDELGQHRYPAFYERMQHEIRLQKQRTPNASNAEVLKRAYEYTEKVDEDALSLRERRDKQQREADSKLKAAAARRASSSISDSTGATYAANGDVSISEAVERLWGKLAIAKRLETNNGRTRFIRSDDCYGFESKQEASRSRIR